MLYTIIKENTYQDSIVLMLLSNKLNSIDGVKKVSVMMGTPANKDIFRASGLGSDELDQANPNDIVVVIDTEDEAKVTEVDEMVEATLKGENSVDATSNEQEAHNWKRAMELANNPNMALISIPGQYAAMEAENALNEGLHVFMFSDNVPKADELRLKEMAHEKGLLVMGPDCGTGIIHSVPLAFTNIVKEGNIGLVGASGTGIQEVTTIIDRERTGVTNAIGTGGRDLSTEIGAITMLDSIKALNQDPQVKVITVISKPPAKEVKDRVLNVLRNIEKPVVTLFLGDKPTYHEPGIYHAYTLEEAARVSVQLSNGEVPNFKPSILTDIDVNFAEGQIGIKGFYSGGTLAYEAAMLINHTLKNTKSEKQEGYMLKTEAHAVIDLGDDIYTQGKPHPMIDPEKRIEMLEASIEDETTAVILLDDVIGNGSHDDMATELAPTISKAIQHAKDRGRNIVVLATVVGTEQDHQGYQQQIDILKRAGAVICETNDQMVRTAIHLLGHDVQQPEREEKAFDKEVVDLTVSDEIIQLLNVKPSIINIGLKSFSEAIRDSGAECVQFNWKPIAGGDEKLMKVLQFLNHLERETV
ncbi:acyl-CoA synthetase FdrA [Staphylococcus pseudintermedius]|uniref:acyl-CoA synthetase FdrA n=1 Tax=Staphylococcus pseudintermedius TaxID=283734 RepID=UPI001035B7A4|nr:acyl-CoA synthetase FdrA [Staphylococcus pseudintermedius]EGQ0362101.1 acyl-CoA synthetase FdrA [Staphylococcus pseudintermedius]EGQ0397584.1 acyl-CoA synthetase FdrA [Staphylococcus pseudintermedius]EGQ1282188.1 acyl-CoA synthetase FdrA [Staphylococcus pseudintermedius]EGQ1294703.1 acyl-CoA synthetase FdrA [Staphylococcus pseudintermedius]EGQ1604947.1 acyl-CoA synthetase FdrA [Staphylococcus pseudintermedius]